MKALISFFTTALMAFTFMNVSVDFGHKTVGFSKAQARCGFICKRKKELKAKLARLPRPPIPRGLPRPPGLPGAANGPAANAACSKVVADIAKVNRMPGPAFMKKHLLAKLNIIKAGCGARNSHNSAQSASANQGALLRNIDRMDCAQVNALLGETSSKTAALGASAATARTNAVAANNAAAAERARNAALSKKKKKRGRFGALAGGVVGHFIGRGSVRGSTSMGAQVAAGASSIQSGAASTMHNLNRSQVDKLSKRQSECQADNYYGNKYNFDKATTNVNGDKRPSLFRKNSRGGKKQFVRKKRSVQARKRSKASARSVGGKQFRMRAGQKSKFTNREENSKRIIGPARQNGMAVRRGSSTTSARSGRRMGRGGSGGIVRRASGTSSARQPANDDDDRDDDYEEGDF